MFTETQKYKGCALLGAGSAGGVQFSIPTWDKDIKQLSNALHKTFTFKNFLYTYVKTENLKGFFLNYYFSYHMMAYGPLVIKREVLNQNKFSFS